MRIKKLTIENYRNFERATITPQTVNGIDIVVLIGENNAGKTNILYLLHSILNPERSVRTIEFSETDFYNPKAPMRVEIVFEDLGDELLAVFESCLLPETVNGKTTYTLPLTFTCTYDEDTKEVEPSLVYSRLPERNVSFADKKLLSFYFQDALRDYRNIRPTSGSLYGRILKQIDISGQESSILEKLQEAGNLLKSNDEVKKFEQAVQDVTSRIIDLPIVDDAIRLTVAASNSVDLKKYINIQVKHALSDVFLDVNQVGLGLQSVLTISIFRAFAGIGMLKEGIFSVDEPEAHLYPHSQRALYREILELSKMRQMWIATHSPSLLELINPRQIVLLKRQPDGKSISIQLPENFPDKFVESYEKHLDVGKSDAFFAKAVLVVEGPTEQGLFPAIGQALIPLSQNYNLDRIGVSIVNAGGKNNLTTMVRLLKNFDIPCVSVVDYDPSDKDHEETLQQIKNESNVVYELPRVPKMSDIEGFVCLYVPIPEMVAFLQEVLRPGQVVDLFADLKGVVKKYDAGKSEQIKAIRKAGKLLTDCVPILRSIMREHKDAESDIRQIFASTLRKVKGRTTGRLIGEKFHEYLPEEFISILDKIIMLAGYSIQNGVSQNDRKSNES